MYGVILAGGNGKRFLQPVSKLLYKIDKKPILMHVVDAMKDAVEKIIIVVSPQNIDEVKGIISKHDKIEIAVQEKALGTGDALLAVEKYTKDKAILMCYGDKPGVSKEDFKKIIEHYNKTKSDVVLATAVLQDPGRKGRILRKNGDFYGIKEYKDANDEERKIKEINVGFYCFSGKNVFSYLKMIENNNAAKEYYLTDIFNFYLKNNKKIGLVNVQGKAALDVNTPEDLKEIVS